MKSSSRPSSSSAVPSFAAPSTALSTAFTIVTLLALGLAPPAAAGDAHWPAWRGPAGSGVAPAGDPPVEWQEDKNLRFKVEVPGKGNSSPVVWGDLLFLTTAVDTGRTPDGAAEEAPPGARGRRGVAPTTVLRFELLAYDRHDGTLRWRGTATEGLPHEGTHPDGSWAAASPVTDGEVVIASFGSRGIYAFSMDGKQLWSRDLGDMETRRGFGEGASPALYGDTLVVNWDHEGPSFIVALDKGSGEIKWRQERDEVTSWSTPLVVEVGGKPQAIVSATGRVRGYDLATGELIWEAGGMTTNAIPSPVYQDGLLYVMSGFRGNALLAIDLAAARGDITGGAAIRWSHDRDTPYVPSPLLYGGKLYFLKSNQGILSCFDAGSGEALFTERLPEVDGVYASPVGAGGRVYIVGRDGTTVVLERTDSFKVLAINQLDEGFDASPAIAGDTLYLRGRQHLYALQEAPVAQGR